MRTWSKGEGRGRGVRDESGWHASCTNCSIDWHPYIWSSGLSVRQNGLRIVAVVGVQNRLLAVTQRVSQGSVLQCTTLIVQSGLPPPSLASSVSAATAAAAAT